MNKNGDGDMKTTGKRIAELRQQRKLSQRSLAKELGVSFSCVSLWETGQRKINIEQLQKVAEYFDVSLDYLTGVDALQKQDLTEEELQLVEMIKGLDEEQTQQLSIFVDFLIAKRNYGVR